METIPNRACLLAATLLGVFLAPLTLLAQADAGRALRLEAIPTGLTPLGVDTTTLFSTPNRPTNIYVAVANSGGDSLSVFEMKFGPVVPDQARLVPVVTVSGIPRPYAVATCRANGAESTGIGNKLLVTSPLDDSISVVQVPEGIVLRTVVVRPQPYSAACFLDGTELKGIVSLQGDNSLAIVDLASGTVVARIPGVPGSRGFHGVRFLKAVGNPIAWVAGTDANVVTLVDLVNSRIVDQLPVRGPTAVLFSDGVTLISSAGDNSVIFMTSYLPGPVVTARPVPGAADVAASTLGVFATTGAGNSLVRMRLEQSSVRIVEVIPGIPGAAGLTAWRLSIQIMPDSQPVVLVTSPESNSLFVIQSRPSLPGEFGPVVDAAAFRGGGVAPGSLATVFVSTGVGQDLAAESLPLPTTLEGVSLRVGGTLEWVNSRWVYSAAGAVLAPLLFVGPNQINFQVPPEIGQPREIMMQLERPDGSTLLTAFGPAPTVPRIFSRLGTGQGPGAVLNRDNSVNMGTNPARRGSFVQIFATGAGATNPPLLAGEPAPISGNPLVFAQVQPTVTIGGRPARVLFSGMAPGLVGVWQINAEVPMDAAPGPAVPLQITAGGVASNTVTIAIQ